MSRESAFGSTTVGLKRLIRREIGARRQRLTGTVVSRMKMIDDDGLGSATWVVDVVVGKLRPLRDVPVKMGADGSRLFAALGQTVHLARNTQGRINVIGPGDHLAAIAKLKKYVYPDTTAVSTDDVGLTFEVLPFKHLKGPTPGTPGTSLWGNGSTPFKVIRVIDGAGNPV